MNPYLTPSCKTVSQVEWMESKKASDIADHKEPTSGFQKEVSRIKYNVTKALDKYHAANTANSSK